MDGSDQWLGGGVHVNIQHKNWEQNNWSSVRCKEGEIENNAGSGHSFYPQTNTEDTHWLLLYNPPQSSGFLKNKNQNY